MAPTAGTVEVNGKPAARARLDRDYGMVFQAPVLFDWRSVEDNVKLPLELMGYDGARRTARAKEMLDLVELSEFTRHRPYQLSGGMQQRVAIARALAFEPSILLMDEPFGALDEMTRERMNQEVLRIWEQTGITVVFVTHSIPEAVFLSSRVVVMSARPGRITDVIEVDLPRPRGVETREERRYFELVTAVREALRRGDVDATERRAGGQGTPRRPRPRSTGPRPKAGSGERHARRSRVGPPGRRRPAARWLRRIAYYWPAIVVFVVAVGVWEAVVRNVEIRGFPLPAPTQIVDALGENWGSGRWPLQASATATLIEAFGGFVIGTTAGVVVALLTARFVTARELLLPIAVGASAVPIIAFAPLMNNWFGVLNPLSKMMIVAVLVFFPVLVNVTRGLTQVEPAALELMRSYAASESTVLRQVRIPNALPYFFTALKVGTTLSLIGAIVGEYFGGTSSVLGQVIVASAGALRFDVTWAAIILVAAVGIAMYLAIVAVERLVIPWHASMRGGGT